MTKRPRAADNVSARTHESCVNYARVQQDEKFQTSEIVETLAESRESVENLKFIHDEFPGHTHKTAETDGHLFQG